MAHKTQTIPLYPFKRSDFPGIRPDEPHLIHVAYADWTHGHNHVLHCHKDRAEIFILLHGNSRYNVGGHIYDISAGDVVLCNPFVMHDEFPEKSVLYDTITIGVGNIHMPGLPEGQLTGNDRIPIIRKSPGTEALTQLLTLILDSAVRGNPQAHMYCHHLMMASLELIRNLPVPADTPVSKTSALCQSVLNYLNEHFMEDITLEETAKRFFVSPWYLSRLFKEETSYNFKQYLLRLRLGEAQMRLSVTGESISEISLDCGFHDPAYFSRIFTRYIGTSPQKYRKMRTIESPEG